MDEKEVKTQGQAPAQEMSLERSGTSSASQIAEVRRTRRRSFWRPLCLERSDCDIREKYGKLTAEELTAKAIA
jgi:hypothetical protein